MAKKTYLDPGWKWSQGASFSQGVRVGDTIYVAGMVALDAEGEVVGKGDMKAQARQTFQNIGTVLAEAGATLADIIKITTYVTDMSKYPDYAKVRAEVFAKNPPTSATVSTPRLANPELMVEVEAIAYVGDK